MMIGFRVTPELRARIEAAADQDRRTISNWMKKVIEEALEAKEHNTQREGATGRC